LQPGVVRIRRAAGKEPEELAISGGVANVHAGGKTLTILVETAERGMELDEQVIAAARARAEAVMQNITRQDDASFAAAAAALQRELARARVQSKYHSRRKSGFHGRKNRYSS